MVALDGDARRIRQIIDNLLSNVRMHTPPGTVTTIQLDAQDVALITLSDNGPGMSTEQATHVFERFYRADPSRSRSSGGSGLGMAIVEALVHAHHGSISLTTAPGRGVTILITLPLGRHQPTPATQMPPSLQRH